MTKIRIKYPQIVFEEKELDVTEGQAETLENSDSSTKAEFIFDNLDIIESRYLTIDFISGALETEYGYIVRVE